MLLLQSLICCKYNSHAPRTVLGWHNALITFSTSWKYASFSLGNDLSNRLAFRTIISWNRSQVIGCILQNIFLWLAAIDFALGFSFRSTSSVVTVFSLAKIISASGLNKFSRFTSVKMIFKRNTWKENKLVFGAISVVITMTPYLVRIEYIFSQRSNINTLITFRNLFDLCSHKTLFESCDGIMLLQRNPSIHRQTQF